MKERDTLFASSNSFFLIQSGPSETNAALEFAVNSLLVSIFLLKKCMTGFIFLIWKLLMLLFIYPSLIYLFTISFGWLCSYLKYKTTDLLITKLLWKVWIWRVGYLKWSRRNEFFNFFFFLLFHSSFVRLIVKHLLSLGKGEVNW